MTLAVTVHRRLSRWAWQVTGGTVLVAQTPAGRRRFAKQLPQIRARTLEIPA